MKLSHYLSLCLMVIASLCVTSVCCGEISGPTSTQVTGGKYYIPQYAGNCVAYVRALVHMPSKDLTYFQGKKGIINSNKPKKGSVAIIKVNSGDYANIGHVAYVHDVDTSGKNVIIELYEANYPRKGIWKRVVKGKHASLSDLEKRLNIVGYYKP